MAKGKVTHGECDVAVLQRLSDQISSLSRYVSVLSESEMILVLVNGDLRVRGIAYSPVFQRPRSLRPFHPCPRF